MLQRPEILFVEPRTKEQRAKAVLCRSREELDAQQNELINAMRSALYEYDSNTSWNYKCSMR